MEDYGSVWDIIIVIINLTMSIVFILIGKGVLLRKRGQQRDNDRTPRKLFFVLGCIMMICCVIIIAFGVGSNLK